MKSKSWSEEDDLTCSSGSCSIKLCGSNLAQITSGLDDLQDVSPGLEFWQLLCTRQNLITVVPLTILMQTMLLLHSSCWIKTWNWNWKVGITKYGLLMATYYQRSLLTEVLAEDVPIFAPLYGRKSWSTLDFSRCRINSKSIQQLFTPTTQWSVPTVPKFGMWVNWFWRYDLWFDTFLLQNVHFRLNYQPHLNATPFRPKLFTVHK